MLPVFRHKQNILLSVVIVALATTLSFAADALTSLDGCCSGPNCIECSNTDHTPDESGQPTRLPSGKSRSGLQLGTGHVTTTSSDISTPTKYGPLSLTRQHSPGGNSNGEFGSDWTHSPFVMSSPGSTTHGQLANGSTCTMCFNIGSPCDPHQFVQATLVGDTWVFIDPITDRVWGIRDKDATSNDKGRLIWETTRQQYNRSNPTSSAIQHTYDTNRHPAKSKTADGINEISYTVDTNGRITKAQLKSSGAVVEQVSYTYRNQLTGTVSSDVGSNSNNLVQAVTKIRPTGGSSNPDDGTWTERVQQYRYDGSSSRITMVLEADSVHRAVQGTSATTALGLFSLGNSAVGEYATTQIEYSTGENTDQSVTTDWGSENLSRYHAGSGDVDETNLVRSIKGNGGASCCGVGTTGQKTVFHYVDTHDTPTSAGFDEVVRLVIEDVVADTTPTTPVRRHIYGINPAGRVLREATITNALSTTNAKYWCSSRIINGIGRILEYRKPSAHDVSSDSELQLFFEPTDGSNDDDTLHLSNGLIYVYEYNHPLGFKTAVRVKKGRDTNTSNNPVYYVSAAEYGDGTAGDAGTWQLRKTFRYAVQTTVAPDNASSPAEVTEYTYTYWSDSAHSNFGNGDSAFDNIKTVTTTLPTVSTGENGSGSATTKVSHFDHLGRQCWSVDGEGYINYFAYDENTGQLAYSVVDADPTSLPSGATGGGSWNAPGAYGASSNAPSRYISFPALELVSTFQFDSNGRTYLRTEPLGNGGSSTHRTRYEKNQTVSFPYWTGTATLLPASVTRLDAGGQLIETFSVPPSKTENGTYGPQLKAVSSSDYVSWTTHVLNSITGRVDEVKSYFDTSSSTAFNKTTYDYDSLGRRYRSYEYADGSTMQISESVFDDLGREVEHRIGKSTSQLATVSRTVYDNDGVGDGHVTARIQYYDTGTTSNNGQLFYYTYRGHLRGTHSIRQYNSGSYLSNPKHTVMNIDWMGRPTTIMRFGLFLSDWSFATGYGTYTPSSTTYRYVHEQRDYDPLGRLYRKTSYNNNSSYYKICVDHFYDRNDQRVASIPSHSAGREFAYDGAGRLYQTRAVKSLSSPQYSSGKFDYRNPEPHPKFGSTNTGVMTGGDQDVVSIEHSLLDDSGLPIERHSFALNHSDTNGINISSTTSYVRSSTYSWHDDANRATTTAVYGSGDTASGAGAWKYTAFSSANWRPTTEPTLSSNTKLVTRYVYNTDSGRLEATLDPAAKTQKTFYDDLGRVTYQVKNYVNFSLSNVSGTTGGGSANDQDQTVKFEYDGLGNVTKITALDRNADGNTTSNDNEVTEYEYNDTYNLSLATKEIYPRGSNDTVTKTFYLDGSPKSRTDQRGVTINYTYKVGTRKIDWEKATIPGGSGVDTAIQSINYTYDFAERPSHIRSYSGVGTGTIENDIEFSYNSRNKIYRSRQSHQGATTTSSPYVYYYYDTSNSTGTYTDGYRNYKVRYPSGKYAEFQFGADDSLDDRLHRVATLRGDFEGTYKDIATYQYSGTRRPVQTMYSTPGVYSANYTSASSPHVYDNVDRFGRTLTKEWRTIFSSVDKTAYQYDYASNRTVRNNLLNTALNQTFTYDGLHRLASTVQTGANQSWELDALGNWNVFSDATGSGVVQSRTHNNANEIATISSFPAWAAPQHDNAGNMTTVPMPSLGSNASGTLTYDAWNRLVKVVNSNGTTEYEYDGLHRRIVKEHGGNGYDYFYNTKWQVVETRKNGGSTPLEMLTWHPQYVDALASRYSQPSGSQVIRFAMQDANFNVTGMLNTSGGADYRYRYSAYGQVTPMNGSWSVLSTYWNSDSANAYTFTGRRFEEESTLYHYRNRDYHTETGRFVNRDPISYRGSRWNLYEYVASRPTVSLDPSGLAIVPPSGPTVHLPPESWPIPHPPYEEDDGAKGAADVGTSCFPGVSTGRDIKEVWTGKDAIWGTQLQPWERGVTCVSIVIPVAGGKIIRVCCKKLGTTAKKCWNTGGAILDRMDPDDWDKAEEIYDALRDTTDDIDDIVENSGIPRSTVERVKDHLFHNEHLLDDGVAQFDAHPDIVNAWERLRDGTATEADFQLLRHEQAESIYEQLYGGTYRDAHEAIKDRWPSGID